MRRSLLALVALLAGCPGSTTRPEAPPPAATVSPPTQASPYQQALARFLKLVDIGEAVLEASPELPAEERDGMIAFGRESRKLAIEWPHQWVESIEQLERDFLTYWYESKGPHIDRFWREVTAAGLTARRRDVIAEVLVRGRIDSDYEHEVVTDSLVVLQQTGRITSAEADRLSKMLGEYERRQAE